MISRPELLPKGMSGSMVLLLKLGSVMMPTACVSTGVIGTMSVEIQGCVESALPDSGAETDDSGPTWKLQQES